MSTNVSVMVLVITVKPVVMVVVIVSMVEYIVETSIGYRMISYPLE